ncbi:MAG: efflux transporter outer membrane subunit [Acidobacteriota bacterium]|jgi:multidrug efflux system outer membrane protein|nr:efflux transporter outer membrane subunit [Acidobacteriota bacterium]
MLKPKYTLRKFILVLTPLALLLCGCPKRAEYARPALPVPESWASPSAAGEGAAATLAPDIAWEEFFEDGNLRAVVRLALGNNRDLRSAALAIEKAQALYRVQAVARRPVVNAQATGTVSQVPFGDDSYLSQQYSVGLGVTAWELDFFGRVKSLTERALEQYLATEQARAATQVSLVYSVAAAYLNLAADRENLALARRTLEAQQASYDLIRQSRDIGVNSDLDVSQARTQVESARADIAQYEGRLAQDGNALQLLVGAPVPEELLPKDLTGIPAPRELGAGLSSEVLLRRPDILMAEHQLKGYQANIGAARAAYFPRIALTGGTGLVGTALDELFHFGWNFAPQATLPIFDSGTRDANYRAAELDRDMAVAAYEKAIQTAFREVGDELSLRASLTERQAAQEALVEALRDTYRLSETRYDAGMDSYLSVLVAQRALYAAEQQLIAIRLARATNLVALYKALGGGA